MRVGVFDSGVGGLTVLKTLIEKYPYHEYIYFGDTKNVPYGNRGIEELKKLTDKIVVFLLSKNIEILVIACGTLSVSITDYIKNKYNIKVMDIITPTIDYIKHSNHNKIGILGTKVTIESNVFKDIDKDIKQVSCHKLAKLIEENNPSIDNYIYQYIKDMKDRDLIVLGCTHYPIVKDKISKMLGNNIKILDMSYCINNLDMNKSNLNVTLYFTKINRDIKENINKILENYQYNLNSI